MSNLQRCFNEFHEIIKLDVENVDLRRSRDAIKSKLGSRLREYFEDKAINKIIAMTNQSCLFRTVMSTCMPTDPKNSGNNIALTNGEVARTALCLLSSIL